MNPRVKKVVTLENFELEVAFSNNETRLFDMKPYLSYPVFEKLKDVSFFNRAKAKLGTVVWDEETDMDPDTLYLESKVLAKV